ncbi:1-acyl-sn-glycerol-3-phosphate acyltransferase [Hypoxylon trugodes]|uniref:1-acyl-sn-glycerol-3-phosphate acyltransferase n=1 Tax=Hypoxylon trugodes TaxID=326681 RepID=UPI00219643DC|nr:1-acyl-sn-glycerol-3-phosphate acyltransferase [Hypoxylon trugodes]KAI1390142.1 1-acyl-sn-glycerol-3-phosphate acyltransferase [Hypoxylon trugodes]
MALLARILANIRGIILVTPWVLYLAVCDVLLSFLLPVKIFAPNFVYRASSRIAYSVWKWIQVIFENFNGARITFSGDRLPMKESAVVISNHVTWADFYMIQALAVRAGMLGQCRWFAKIQLRWVPFLGWGLWAMGMPMVSRNWMRDQRELQRVFGGIVGRRWPIWLISFSEATRFTPKKYEESKIWCKENDRPQPLHLLYPRTKGFITTVRQLRKAPHVKAVYDFTIAYQKKASFHIAPDMWETLKLSDLGGSQGYRFHIHARRFPLEELPHTDEELAKWLEQRWVEKGEWLDTLKTEWDKS